MGAKEGGRSEGEDVKEEERWGELGVREGGGNSVEKKRAESRELGK